MPALELRDRFLQYAQQRLSRRAGRPHVPDTPTTRLVKQVGNADIEEAFSGAVGRPLGEKDAGAFAIITRNIDWSVAEKYLPSRINLVGLVRVVREVSSIGNLQKPLESAVSDEQEAVLQYLKVPSLDKAVVELNNSNDMAAGTAITNALLGAVVGNNIKKVISRNEVLKISDDKVINETSLAYGVALEVGRRFATPANSPEEFLERVQILIPNPDEPHSQSGNSLQELFVKYNTFDTYNRSGPIRCPAIHVTGEMLKVWGRNLASNESYRRRFIQVLAK